MNLPKFKIVRLFLFVLFSILFSSCLLDVYEGDNFDELYEFNADTGSFVANVPELISSQLMWPENGNEIIYAGNNLITGLDIKKRQ